MAEFDLQWRERVFLPVDGDLTLKQDEAARGVGREFQLQGIGAVVIAGETGLGVAILFLRGSSRRDISELAGARRNEIVCGLPASSRPR